MDNGKNDQYERRLTCHPMLGRLMCPFSMYRKWLAFLSLLNLSENFGKLFSPSTPPSSSSGCTMLFRSEDDRINLGSSIRSFFGMLLHPFSLYNTYFEIPRLLRFVSNSSCPVDACDPIRCRARCSTSDMFECSSMSADVCLTYHEEWGTLLTYVDLK